ncbi:protein-glucosylgalactosylhydroxylysine glucosidase [Pararge aegeria]|uniref:protein-glucosylgalactosylhydroxylysine glucosidase n=1 Tax=Pararge aegeria TaxID=116150 RepID=UPI0019D2596B|nr:protein-glucosylgalactosylhydroxylysine glucosidase [Pararge aegeria]XP_039765166.1 protein-glucosylgalactosylhydroxylysine glucosidase [Pararge aegeria]
MWNFLARNKQVAAMLGLLGAAALVVIFLATRGRGHVIVEQFLVETEDVSEDPYIFSAHSLPSDDRFMPSIGNGHLATNVFSDTVYMNGLYNGRKGESRRARIPAWANIRLNSTLTNHPYSPVYSLDTKHGVFQVTVDRDRSVVTQRIFAHRYYTRSIVNQIKVEPKTHADPNFVHHEIWIAIKQMPGPESKDISFGSPTPEIINEMLVWKACGKTKEVEDPAFQGMLEDVCAYWSSVPDHLVVPHSRSKVITFFMTVDKNESVARQEFIKILQEDGEELFEKHVEQWGRLYKQGGLEIEGNLQLAKIVNGIWYYFLSSLPSEESHFPLDRFFGLSPTGLARGGTFDDYEGHSFWDTEMWMFPPILVLYPQYARQLLQYRLDNAYVAAELARITGSKGYRFPWESAYTGSEVTQPCCPDVAEFEQHITACIAFAARQYLSMTRDEDWLKHGGCSIVTNIADFWASRAVINYSSGLYDIANVMGPDEDHSNVTNSVFTNVVAGYSLYLAQYVACQCKSYYMAKDPDHWADIAWSLTLPYDETLDYHPQFQGYRRGEGIKQADAVLLGFPLQYPMNISTRINDLTYYESVTRGNGPAMTWSMHTIGQLQIQDNLRAATLFNKSYEGYVREPFKVWTELRRPKVGAVNFHTGMGGFLQTLMFGYAGIRIHLNRLEITQPQLPPEATKFRIKGIKYLGSNLTLDIRVLQTTLTVISVDDDWPLLMYNGKYNVTLVPGMIVTLKGTGPFTIRTVPWKDCKLPVDTIGQNYLRPIGL